MTPRATTETKIFDFWSAKTTNSWPFSAKGATANAMLIWGFRIQRYLLTLDILYRLLAANLWFRTHFLATFGGHHLLNIVHGG